MVSGPIAVKAKDIDNVATVFADDVVDGTLVMVHDAGGNQAPTKVIGDIPYGHKIALRDISEMLGVSLRTLNRRISEMPTVKYIGSGYSGHWEIDDN